MFNWRITRLINFSRASAVSLVLEKVVTAIPQRFFVFLFWLEVLVVILLFLWPGNIFYVVIVTVLFLLQMKRHYFSFDGADQMVFVVLVAATLGTICRSQRSAVFFLAGEVTLAYLVAGLYKVSSPYWKRGRALLLITQTRLFGHEKVAAILQAHPVFATATQFILVFWESSFVVSLIAPPKILTMFLIAGIVFHISCAWIMGLNTFPWAFVASYPSIVYVNREFRSFISPAKGLFLTGCLAAAIICIVVMGGAYVYRRNGRNSLQVSARMPEPVD